MFSYLFAITSLSLASCRRVTEERDFYLLRNARGMNMVVSKQIVIGSLGKFLIHNSLFSTACKSLQMKHRTMTQERGFTQERVINCSLVGLVPSDCKHQVQAASGYSCSSREDGISVLFHG